MPTQKPRLTKHAQRRIAERLPFALTRDMRKQIAEQIKNGKAQIIKRHSIKKAVWRVFINDWVLSRF